MHAQALLSSTHRVTATTPRHCSTTRTCPSSKPHPENDPGLSTSLPFLVISTKNIWRQAKPHGVWQTLLKCMNVTLNTFAFSAISDGNNTVLQINVFKDSVIRTVTTLMPAHVDSIPWENHTKWWSANASTQYQLGGVISITEHQSWAVVQGFVSMYPYQNEFKQTRWHTITTEGNCGSAQRWEVECTDSIYLLMCP